MQTLKRRAAVTGTCVGALTATAALVFMPASPHSRWPFVLLSSIQLGWITYFCLSPPLRDRSRRAALLVRAGAVAVPLVTMLFTVLV